MILQTDTERKVLRMDFDKYLIMAKEMGAKNAVEFKLSDIIFDPRVALKCVFGCPDYGKNHTCPFQKSPLNLEQYKETFSRYEGGIIIGCATKKLSHSISFEIERASFLDGHYFAFSLSDCSLCSTCSKAVNEDCRVPSKARPAFHSIGVDVFKTVNDLGLPLTVAKDMNGEINWYSAVFIK